MRHWLWPGAVATLVGLLLAGVASAATVVVGSKNFEESRLLGELFAQAIEERTELTVERRLGLAGTDLCFEALRAGAIDLYPEYTGTGWVTLLGREPLASPSETLIGVRKTFRERYDLDWLAPLGFENAFELAVPRALAEQRSLRTISDLATVASDLRAGFGHEFAERSDGLPGLQSVYGLRFASVQTMLHAPKFAAVGTGAIDVLDVYTTDGRLVTHDLTVLDDDRGFFPPYQAAALVRGETLRRHPEIAVALAALEGVLSGERMRALNLRLQEGKEEEAVVASDVLIELGLRRPAADAARARAGAAPASAPTERRRRGVFATMVATRGRLAELTLEHLALVAVSLGFGVLVALPLAFALERTPPAIAETAIRFLGVTQTIPSLALLGFLVPLLGIGVAPTLFALWLYSLFPIVRNAYSGLRDADPMAVLSATALGMTEVQVLRRVRLPLAASTIMAGIRTAAVINVGTATLAAFIGAGGLGEPIIAGVQLVDSARILSGAIPAAVLALLVDLFLQRIERWVRPRGLAVAPRPDLSLDASEAP